jgi:hypothetical protein
MLPDTIVSVIHICRERRNGYYRMMSHQQTSRNAAAHQAQPDHTNLDVLCFI